MNVVHSKILVEQEILKTVLQIDNTKRNLEIVKVKDFIGLDKRCKMVYLLIYCTLVLQRDFKIVVFPISVSFVIISDTGAETIRLGEIFNVYKDLNEEQVSLLIYEGIVKENAYENQKEDVVKGTVLMASEVVSNLFMVKNKIGINLCIIIVGNRVNLVLHISQGDEEVIKEVT